LTSTSTSTSTSQSTVALTITGTHQFHLLMSEIQVSLDHDENQLTKSDKTKQKYERKRTKSKFVPLHFSFNNRMTTSFDAGVLEEKLRQFCELMISLESLEANRLNSASNSTASAANYNQCLSDLYSLKEQLTQILGLITEDQVSFTTFIKLKEQIDTALSPYIEKQECDDENEDEYEKEDKDEDQQGDIIDDLSPVGLEEISVIKEEKMGFPVLNHQITAESGNNNEGFEDQREVNLQNEIHQRNSLNVINPDESIDSNLHIDVDFNTHQSLIHSNDNMSAQPLQRHTLVRRWTGFLEEDSSGETLSARQNRLDERIDVSCTICYNHYSKDEIYTYENCRHHFCKECLNHYYTTDIMRADVLNIKCPDTSCDTKVQPHEIQAIVSEEVYNKYLHFHSIATLKLDPTSRWCPRPDCETIVKYNELDGFRLVCPRTECAHQFCAQCSEPWHPNLTCEENEKKLIGLKRKHRLDRLGTGKIKRGKRSTRRRSVLNVKQTLKKIKDATI